MLGGFTRIHINMNNQADTRPKKVSSALMLIYITLAMGIIRFLLVASAKAEMSGSRIATLILIIFVVFGIMAWFVAMIGRRKNWARIAFLVLFLIGLFPFVLALIQSFSISTLSGILGLAQTVLQGFALVLLFQKESSDWFRNRVVSHEST